MPAGCIFCQIIAGESPASVVHRDDKIIAFMDIHPLTPGHTLVAPLKHAESVLELDDDGTTERMALAGRRVAAALQKTGVRMTGFNLWLADGATAGQTVFHTHLHVIPRFPGDGLGFRRPALPGRPPRARLDDLAAQIRQIARWGP